MYSAGRVNAPDSEKKSRHRIKPFYLGSIKTRMQRFSILFLVVVLLAVPACRKKDPVPAPEPRVPIAWQGLKTLTHQGVSVQALFDVPAAAEVDVLLVCHGTVIFDSLIVQAAYNTRDGFKRLSERTDLLYVSVAYPEENLLFGDNFAHAEAALRWVRDSIESTFGIRMRKLFLAGHSQGGYLVTRLATRHFTDGVVANAPGPLNLVYRCGLEEQGKIPNGITCDRLRNVYGRTDSNPDAYMQRSLLNFTRGFKSDILFIQGLNDSPIQMYSWPTFIQDVKQCSDCKQTEAFEVPGFGHQALFESAAARTRYNAFLNR